jgi:hypothetical protein
MTADDKIPTPAFMFGRLRHIEIEAGLILAGTLVVDLPKDREPKRKQKRMVNEIVQRLTAAVQAGQITEDTTEIFGWRDGCRPDNADAFVKSEEAKASWAKDRLTIAVRVDARDDGMLRIDSNLRKQMGLLDS